jgi:hypothetical protein
MRALLILVTSIALIACGPASGRSGGDTSLRIAYWEGGAAGRPDLVWTLRCRPPGGSLRAPARACARLDAGGRALFASLSPKVVCTEIYGGPQRARVTGVLDGKRIWATFARSNGCHIARWARLSPWLLPPGGIT